MGGFTLVHNTSTKLTNLVRGKRYWVQKYRHFLLYQVSWSQWTKAKNQSQFLFCKDWEYHWV